MDYIERLKVCFYVLTNRNFFFISFNTDKKLLLYNDNKELIGVNNETIHGFYDIENVVFNSGKTLRTFLCDTVIHIVNKIRNYDFKQ